MLPKRIVPGLQKTTLRTSMASAWLIVPLNLLAASCDGSAGGEEQHGGAWVQFERHPADLLSSELRIEQDGAFAGSDSSDSEDPERTTSAEGTLSAVEVSQLKSLFSSKQVSIYQADSVLTPEEIDNGADIGVFPFYRVVLRNEKQQKSGGPGGEVLEVYLVDEQLEPETQDLISFAVILLDRYATKKSGLPRAAPSTGR